MSMDINALIVPTGIGARIGGFAGDANPVARLLANVSDYLITHPNVVNGASMTKIPENVLVLEGHLMDEFFLNRIALRPKVKHKIAIVVDSDISAKEKEIIANVHNAAKHFYGLDLLDLVWTDEPVDAQIQAHDVMQSGDIQAAIDDCQIANTGTLFAACEKAIAAGATALAPVCKIADPPETAASQDYIAGKGYDPIGLVEAKISHLVAKEFMLPCAHAPVLEPPIYEEIMNAAIVHPQVSAEYIGFSFLPSVLQCLNHSAGIVNIKTDRLRAGDITVDDLANLVVPYDSCDGVPMHEAHKHDIDLVSVKDNSTNLNKTAKSLGLKHSLVENYLEAAGYLAANRKSNEFVDPKLFASVNSVNETIVC